MSEDEVRDAMRDGVPIQYMPIDEKGFEISLYWRSIWLPELHPDTSCFKYRKAQAQGSEQ